METLRFIPSTQNGVLQIHVPANFNTTPLEVIVTRLTDKTISTEERLQSVKKYFGTAKFPNTAVNKDDPYNE